MRPETSFTPAPASAPASAPGPARAARRALSAASGAGLAVEWLAPETLAPGEQARWARLSERSGGSNVFALDWFMGAALHHCAGGQRVRLAVVRQADGEWLGALPLVLAARIGRAPIPHWQGWRATNQFLGGPLVASGGEEAFWRAMLGALDRRAGAGLALMCDGLAADEPATLALLSAVAEDGRRSWIPRRTDRPARLARGVSGAGPAATPALKKARARLASLDRRLAREMGDVRIETCPPESDPADWIARFLALERAGWKGHGGSALACEPCNAALFRETIREGHRRGLARLASLAAGERTLAMTSWFECAGRAFGFKMAHDESARRHAPGRLLMRAVAEELAADPALPFDTCAGEGAPSDPFWPDRRQVIDCVVAIGSPARRGVLAGAMGSAAFWRGLNRP